MPPEFEHLSLDEILYQYADKLSENTGIQVTYTSGSCNPIPNETAYELYRIVQEITMNIVKHANAHCISIIRKSKCSRILKRKVHFTKRNV